MGLINIVIIVNGNNHNWTQNNNRTKWCRAGTCSTPQCQLIVLYSLDLAYQHATTGNISNGVKVVFAIVGSFVLVQVPPDVTCILQAHPWAWENDISTACRQSSSKHTLFCLPLYCLPLCGHVQMHVELI